MHVSALEQYHGDMQDRYRANFRPVHSNHFMCWQHGRRLALLLKIGMIIGSGLQTQDRLLFQPEIDGYELVAFVTAEPEGATVQCGGESFADALSGEHARNAQAETSDCTVPQHVWTSALHKAPTGVVQVVVQTPSATMIHDQSVPAKHLLTISLSHLFSCFEGSLDIYKQLNSPCYRQMISSETQDSTFDTQ